MSNGIPKRIDPILDDAIKQMQEQFQNRISYREASKLIGENHLILMKKKKNIIVWNYP